MAENSRWEDLELLQAEYPTFQPFLFDVMTDLLGFQCSDIQLDIADYLEHGPTYRMIQAQRGQAKTTITAAYGVWRLIHDPSKRILIVSAGGDMAAEIGKWVIQIIMGMEILECLRPDRSIGDRSSAEKFDIHYDLKGPEKSASITSLGITSNLQGKRADILIADDVESAKNSMTEGMRERLKHLTLDFTSINSTGDIIYLGTPQSIDSIYNGLVSRGYDIRIWPGRYPTEQEAENYGHCLAPMIRSRLEADPSLATGGGPTGTRGKAVDPVLLPEDVLCRKEIDQGAAYFQLQHMLDTRLADAERFPLKSDKLIMMRVPRDSAPLTINTLLTADSLVRLPAGFPIEDKFYRAFSFGDEFAPFQSTHMYVDPAGGGQNGDETAYAVTKFSGGRVYLVAIGGVKGGLDDAALDELTKIAVKWQPTQIDIEENYGKGALRHVWTPKLLKEYSCRIEPVWESGQKELRIIGSLEPVIGSGRLVVEEDLLVEDWASVQQYPAERRASYSLFYQLSRLTRDRDCLAHDDRLDALAGSVRFWTEYLSQDADRAVERLKAQAYQKMISDPLGYGKTLYNPKSQGNARPTAAQRMRRKV
ncbi:terminase large subunit [Phage MedPE-SWcel-C56]|uniref:Terminase large subunit ribonuclease H-like domain-containing protein n=1 Tax=Phage MedPE-SWcel-C56 TaxID=1871314 RepID=A0A1B1IY34_9CAUD|nr:terminase large subunit [Phage MedPE-SWcel-C56]ANS06241.1 hypothetical protein [Phage MedPE-SWcel-C56]